MILLDTNAYSAFFRKDNRVKGEIDKAKTVFLSVITIGELLLGFKEGYKLKENLENLSDFVSYKRVKILPVTYQTSKCYSEIKFELRREGTPIPDNDIWIAAHAMQMKATMVSYDEHFRVVQGIKLWKWGEAY
jgi:predicted nucleic acid-binding protein